MWLDLYLKIFQKLPSVSYNVYLIKHTECSYHAKLADIYVCKLHSVPDIRDKKNCSGFSDPLIFSKFSGNHPLNHPIIFSPSGSPSLILFAFRVQHPLIFLALQIVSLKIFCFRVLFINVTWVATAVAPTPAKWPTIISTLSQWFLHLSGKLLQHLSSRHLTQMLLQNKQLQEGLVGVKKFLLEPTNICKLA